MSRFIFRYTGKLPAHAGIPHSLEMESFFYIKKAENTGDAQDTCMFTYAWRIILPMLKSRYFCSEMQQLQSAQCNTTGKNPNAYFVHLLNELQMSDWTESYYGGKRKGNSQQKHQFVDYIMDLSLVTWSCQCNCFFSKTDTCSYQDWLKSTLIMPKCVLNGKREMENYLTVEIWLLIALQKSDNVER